MLPNRFIFVSTILIAIGLLMGCSGSLTIPMDEITPTAMLLSVPSTTPLPPTATDLPISPHTPTVVPPSLTLPPTVMEKTVELLDTRMQYQCLDVLSEMPKEATVTGTLVLDSLYDPPLLLNIETGEMVIIPEEDTETISFGGVTPDGQWLSYDKITRDGPVPQGQVISWTLHVISAENKQLISIPWKDEWTGGSWWLNNVYLAIDSKAEPLNTVVFLDPFSGEQRLFYSNYPDIENNAPLRWGENSFNLTVYAPDLSRVVYPSWSEEHRKASYVIWDLESDMATAELPFPDTWSYPPRWSPDGNRFIVGNPQRDYTPSKHRIDDPWPGDELYLISREGEVNQLTTFSDIFDQYINIYHYIWSPDSRYIAFWLDINLLTDAYTPDGELAVLDVYTNEVTVYCIRGNFASGPGEPPIWSPNSKQLLVESITEDGEDRVILIDIIGGYAVEVIRGYTPVGWMVSSSP